MTSTRSHVAVLLWTTLACTTACTVEQSSGSHPSGGSAGQGSLSPVGGTSGAAGSGGAKPSMAGTAGGTSAPSSAGAGQNAQAGSAGAFPGTGTGVSGSSGNPPATAGAGTNGGNAGTAPGLGAGAGRGGVGTAGATPRDNTTFAGNSGISSNGGSGGVSGAGAGRGGGGSAGGSDRSNGGVAGTAGAASNAGASGTVCIPTAPATEVCDGIDNDCNGFVDDRDVGGDMISDCLDIVLLGAPGANASSNFVQWLKTQGSTVRRIHDSASPALLTAADLGGADVVILDFLQREYSTAESQVLYTWMASGGGVMSMNGHSGSSDLARGNSLLVSLGVQHLAGLYSGDIVNFTAHPLTTGLTSVSFKGGYCLDSLPGAKGSTVVARRPDCAVGLALERGAGLAFIWGDEWVEFDSEWQTLPQIKQFWINSLGWLSRTR